MIRLGADLGNYRVLSMLGEGGMGLVYLAEHRDALAKEHPGLPFTEVTKLLGERYRQLDAETKRQLAEVADANRAATRDEKTQPEPVKAKVKEPVVAGEKHSSMELVSGSCPVDAAGDICEHKVF